VAPELDAELSQVQAGGAELRGFRVENQLRPGGHLVISARSFRATGYSEAAILLTLEEALSA
jgi:hypothetical protein